MKIDLKQKEQNYAVIFNQPITFNYNNKHSYKYHKHIIYTIYSKGVFNDTISFLHILNNLK